MTGNITTDLLLVVGLAIVIIIGYYLFKRIRKPKYQVGAALPTSDAPEIKEGSEEVKGYTDITAGVFDNESRKLTYDNKIPVETVTKIVGEHGSLGRQWNRDGQYIYAMVKDAKYDCGYCPLGIPPRSDNDPVKLHYDMQQPEIPVIMNMEEDKNFFQQYGKVLWWIAVIAFIIFMIMSSRSG